MQLKSIARRWPAAVAAAVLGAGVPGAGGAMAAPVPLSTVTSPIDGTWRTQNGTEVNIAPCGESFCGTLSFIVIPPDYAALCEQDKAAFGAQMLDSKNPDRALRSRPMLGMQMMTLQPTGDPRAFIAHVYSAEDGKSYDGNAWVVDHDKTLRLGGGCLGSICVVTQDWPRVPDRPDGPDFTCRQN